ncbi:MAG: hypothetical protein Q9226_006662 [Calogaya cf. arnoldii]
MVCLVSVATQLSAPFSLTISDLEQIRVCQIPAQSFNHGLLSDDYKEIVVEESSTDPEWENFQKKIMDAKSSYKGKEGAGPRYAPRMTYASSKEALKNALNGVGAEVQANNEDEIEYSTILSTVSKGKR